jgi:hypothetical protein
LLGDGYGGTTTNLLWETLSGATVTGSGFVGGIAKGTVVGWYDSSTFDTLEVAAGEGLTASSVLGDFQAIALDNVRVQLSPTRESNVPEPVSLSLLALGGVGLAVVVRRKRTIA